MCTYMYVGEGNTYHLSRMSQARGGLERSGCVTLRGVPRHKLEDGAFWYFFLRPLVYASDDNGPAQLYDCLLPFLREEALHAISSSGAVASTTSSLAEAYNEQDQDFRRETISMDSSYAQCVFGVALRRALTSSGLASERAKYIAAHALEQIAAFMCADLESMKAEDKLQDSEAVLVGLVARELAYEVSCFIFKSGMYAYF